LNQERGNKAVYDGRSTQTSEILKPYTLSIYVNYIPAEYIFYIATKKKKEEENRNNAHTAPTTRSLWSPGTYVSVGPAKQRNIL
jgi:hypothetical protein